MKKCVILPSNTIHNTMNTTVDTEEKVDFDTLQDDLTPEQRAYWEASIERDLRNIAEGKLHEYLTLDEFEKKLIEAVMRHYEEVGNEE